MFRLLFLFLFLCVLYKLQTTTRESFVNNCGCGRCPLCMMFSRSECPTRNMSYDIRGEEYFPLRTNFPFDNSVIGPSNRRCYPRRFWRN
jgi:hypothetical protein